MIEGGCRYRKIMRAQACLEKSFRSTYFSESASRSYLSSSVENLSKSFSAWSPLPMLKPELGCSNRIQNGSQTTPRFLNIFCKEVALFKFLQKRQKEKSNVALLCLKLEKLVKGRNPRLWLELPDKNRL